MALASNLADAMYFPGRAATIYYRAPATGEKQASSTLDNVTSTLKEVLNVSPKGDVAIGSLGILHPTVIQNYSIVNPCSSLEINVEPFL